jgi:hypothetical protein
MKATDEVVKQRVEAVLKIRLMGAQFHDIREYAAETDAETGRPWNVSDSQLRRYIDRSDALLEKYAEKDREKIINRHLAQRKAMFARAMEGGDIRTALAVAKDEAELLALYPQTQIQVNGKGLSPITLNVVEVVVGREPVALENIVEEVVGNDCSHAHSGGSLDAPHDPPSPSPAGLSAE